MMAARDRGWPSSAPGPAGAFAAACLLRARGDAEIDLFERLPTPWGLLRGGVAPDHQEIKRLEDDVRPPDARGAAAASWATSRSAPTSRTPS